MSIAIGLGMVLIVILLAWIAFRIAGGHMEDK